MALPLLELPTKVYDEGGHVWLDISFPASVRMEWLLNLYILRYDQEPFGVILDARERIAARVLMRPELHRPGRAEWGHNELRLILDDEELDYWIHAFRRWYQHKWDSLTPPHLDVDFDPESTNVPGGLDLVLAPGSGREVEPHSSGVKRGRSRRR